MSERAWPDLRSILSALAAESVRVQERLDAAARQYQEQFAALLATAPEPLPGLLLPIAPATLVVKEFRIDCALRIATTRSTELTLAATPLSVGYHALYEVTVAERSCISIVVRAVPGRTRI